MNRARQFTVGDVLPLAQAYIEKPGNGAGGNLHLVLDDMNVHDDHVSYCLRKCLGERHVWTERWGWARACRWPQWVDPDGVRLCMALLHLSRSQRARVCLRLDWSWH